MAAAPALQGPDAWALTRPLLPGSVALAATDPRAPQPPARPEERAALSRARPQRLREFDAGRAATHRAMAQLGVPPAPVLHGPDRAPVWPDGLTGTITHCQTACLAAVARTRDLRALGLDLEDDSPLAPDLLATVCTAAELDRLGPIPPGRRGQVAKLIFSAKEAAYKAQYPLSRALFDFQTLEITFGDGPGRFAARFRHAVPPFSPDQRLDGRFAVGGGLIVTAVTVPA